MRSFIKYIKINLREKALEIIKATKYKSNIEKTKLILEHIRDNY